MVSPPDKHGGVLALPTSGIIQAAENGDGLAYLSLGSIEEAPQGNRAVESSSVLAHRESDGDWNSKDITPPHVKATAVRDAEYKLMTPDLSRALLEARDEAPLSPWTTERTPYLRENTEPPQYTPLLTSAEGHANVPPGTEFGQSLDLMGATRDLSEVALRSKAPLVPGAEENSLYLWRAGQIKAVSKLPSTGGGGPNVVSGSLGSGVGSVRNAISDDGVRVFWAPGEGYSSVGIELPALYLYDTSAEESVRLDVPEAGASEEGETRPAFQGASADGTIVFFTDSQRLTKDASATGRDLYRCEIPSGTAMTGCASLIDVSAPPAGSGESANVKDQVLAISQDGRRIYFVAGGALDTRANQNGSSANTGEPNLYLWQEGDGVRFVATLSEGDAPDWGAGPTRVIGYSGRSSVGSSPSGRYLAFMSDRSLTGYDSRETSAAEAAEEVFRYDAVGEELLCVSCNASGANPQAVLMPNRIGVNKKVDTQGMWAERWVAATLPEARTEDFGDSFYRPRSVLENGRVFFNSYDSLVSADSNNEWDVYQYEPTSTGSCTAASRGPALARLPAGCVSLISSGTGDEEAAFLDASASGDDVFFLTAAALSALDEDDLYDAYDARVGGVVAERLPHSACSGDACQPAPQSPAASTPASFSFHGSGNLIASKCGEIVHRATRLRTRARALRRKAAGANSQVAMRMRRRATALSRKASRLSKRAKRCRRANRRATR
jgi:hypothetical protein